MYICSILLNINNMLLSQLELGQHFRLRGKMSVMVYLGYLEGVHYYHYVHAKNEDADENSSVADFKVVAIK